MKLHLGQTMSSRMRVVLILFLAFSVSSCALWPGYQEGLVKGQEDYLEAYLSRMRDALKKYTSEKRHPPQTLNDLIDAGYLPIIPPDPMTEKADWIVVRYNCAASSNCQDGIKDIHSASTAKSSRGNPYAEW